MSAGFLKFQVFLNPHNVETPAFIISNRFNKQIVTRFIHLSASSWNKSEPARYHPYMAHKLVTFIKKQIGETSVFLVLSI